MANMVTSIVMKLVDQVTRPVRRIQQGLSQLGQRAGLDRLTRSARALGRSMGGVVQQARALGQRVLIMGGVAAGAVWGVTRLVSGVADLGTEIKQSSERLGVGSTWLQEWMHVGRQFGVQNDALVDGMKELGMRADEFVLTAGGPAAEAFGRLGISAAQLKKTKGNTEALFNLVLGRLREVDNFAARQRLVDEIFGGSGGEQMAQMISATKEELEAMIRTGRQIGAIIPEDQIQAAREYTRQMGNLEQMVSGLRNSIVGALLPALTDWIKRVSELGRANREMISQRILDGLRELWKGLQSIGRAVSVVASWVGGFGNLLTALGALMAGKLILSIASTALALAGLTRSLIAFVARGAVAAFPAIANLGKSMLALASRAIPVLIGGFRALSATLLTTPLGWFLLGIGLLAGAAYLIYQNWDGIAKWFGDLWASIQAFFDRSIGDIAADLLAFSPAGLLLKGIDEVFKLFTDRSLTEVGSEWIGGLWGGIKARWGQLTNWMSLKVAELTNWMPDWAREQLGIGAPPQAMGSPQAALGEPVARGGAAGAAVARADVGGELRIVIDDQGRARATETRRNGGLDFAVDSGPLGFAP